MADALLSSLSHWANFYVIVGSSAGALTGLQFVVITLVTEAEAAGSMTEIRAFGTPTVVHFCAALLISVIMAAPWDALAHLALCVGIFGASGLVYALRVIRHARTQTGYSPDAEDWLWYTALPVVAYAALLSSAFLILRDGAWGLFVIAATSLLFLFIGIHNAWDTVTYVAIKKRDKAQNRSGS